MKSFFYLSLKEPFRILFPLGTIFLLWGALLWLPQIWNSGAYPVLTHRYLVLNGFMASFIAGFLMTVVPKYLPSKLALKGEIFFFIMLTLVGLEFSTIDDEQSVLMVSALQAVTILFFLLARIFENKINDSYSLFCIFVFAGLVVWTVSSFISLWAELESVKDLLSEGAAALIIMGVASLGYSSGKPKLASFYTYLIIVSFIGSYFLPAPWGAGIRAFDVTFIGLKTWQLYKIPRNKSVLERCIWFSAWMIVLSFILKTLWINGLIHASHAFFIKGIVLIGILFATRLLQSFGPDDMNLENKKILYWITFLIVFSGMTRVSAVLIEEHYLSHLGYSSLLLSLGILFWACSHLRFVTRS